VHRRVPIVSNASQAQALGNGGDELADVESGLVNGSFLKTPLMS